MAPRWGRRAMRRGCRATRRRPGPPRLGWPVAAPVAGPPRLLRLQAMRPPPCREALPRRPGGHPGDPSAGLPATRTGRRQPLRRTHTARRWTLRLAHLGAHHRIYPFRPPDPSFPPPEEGPCRPPPDQTGGGATRRRERNGSREEERKRRRWQFGVILPKSKGNLVTWGARMEGKPRGAGFLGFSSPVQIGKRLHGCFAREAVFWKGVWYGFSRSRSRSRPISPTKQALSRFVASPRLWW